MQNEGNSFACISAAALNETADAIDLKLELPGVVLAYTNPGNVASGCFLPLQEGEG